MLPISAGVSHEQHVDNHGGLLYCITPKRIEYFEFVAVHASAITFFDPTGRHLSLKMSSSGSQAKTFTIPRYHSLDSLRAVMMLLGLVLHSAASYITIQPANMDWPYQDPESSVFFNWLIDYIHIFRMPVFFLVSGFFAAYLLKSRGARAFLKHRWSRIAVPFLIAWLILLPVTAVAMRYAQQFNPLALATPTGFTAASNETPLLQRNLLMHLWFLLDLFMFCAAATILDKLIQFVPEGIRTAFLDAFQRLVHRGAILVFALLSGLVLYQMNSWSIDYSGVILRPPRVLLNNGLFFFFGWLLFMRRDAIAGFKRPAWIYILAGTACFLASRYFAEIGCGTDRICDPTAVREHILAILFLAPAVWLLVYGFMGLFLRYLSKQSTRWRYMLDASYWIYLVHLPLVMVLPTILVSVALPSGVKFLLVIIVATVLVTVTYDIFVRSTFIGKQLNGRRFPRGLVFPPNAAAG